jgi:hypothetical protein
MEQNRIFAIYSPNALGKEKMQEVWNLQNSKIIREECPSPDRWNYYILDITNCPAWLLEYANKQNGRNGRI